MPFVLLFIGLLLTIVAVRDNQDAFFAQVTKDFTGQNNFTTWIIAIVAIGSLGYIKPLKTPVDLFLGLMLIGFFVSNKSGFENLLPSIQNAFTSSGSSSAGTAGTQSATPPVAENVSPPAATGANAQEQTILNEVTGSDSALENALAGGNSSSSNSNGSSPLNTIGQLETFFNQ